MNRFEFEKLNERIKSRTQRINDQLMSLSQTAFEVRKIMRELDLSKYPKLISILEEMLAQVEIMSSMEQ